MHQLREGAAESGLQRSVGLLRRWITPADVSHKSALR